MEQHTNHGPVPKCITGKGNGTWSESLQTNGILTEQQSLRIVPESSEQEAVSSVAFGEAAAHAPGLQDVLRTQEGPLSIASKVNGRHPLEARVGKWEQTQHETRMEMYRRVFGAGEPVRRGMELAIVEASEFRPSMVSSGAAMHRDILMNKDARVEWEEVYPNGFESGNAVADFHTQMERAMGM